MRVPIFRQKKNTCGPTALKMVFKFFGKDVSIVEIIKGVGGIKKYGVRTVNLAELSKKRGFQVECLSYNRSLARGKARIKKPNTEDIIKYLEKKIPVIIAVRSSLLYSKRVDKIGHFIVITKHKDGVFNYNDPLDGERHRIWSENLRFAWFNNVLDSSAYLLATWPRKLLLDE